MGRNSDQARWCIAPSTDWSLLELGLFEQVRGTLEAQGVHVEVESGMTDEGEPWFVFCDADSGELLCHCARLGSKYIACVPFDDAGTTGTALTEVLDDFFSTWPRRMAPWASQVPVSHEKI
jgi:hypothetical protein